MSHQDPLPDISKAELDLEDLDIDADCWSHTLPDGRTVRAILVGTWVVSLWYANEMIDLWEKPYGVA